MMIHICLVVAPYLSLPGQFEDLMEIDVGGMDMLLEDLH